MSAEYPDRTSLFGIRFVPYQNRDSGVVIEIEDLGYLLRVLGITSELLEGQTTLKGIVSQQADTITFNGDLEIFNYSVLNLPIFVQLLRLMSPVGVLGDFIHARA